jgi:hypothetical protein
MRPAMKTLVISFFICALGAVLPAAGQDTFAGVDLLYPELAHPREDAQASIKKRDFRFIAIDRYGQDIPGLEQYPSMRWTYGTRFVRQPFRIFATNSQNFSFAIRARAYAKEYNQTLLHYLLRAPDKHSHP